MLLSLKHNTHLHKCIIYLHIVFKLFRQKQKTSSKGERASSAKSKSSESRTSKSDSGYSGSGLEASVATISAVDCIIEDEKPAKKSPKLLSRNNQGRSSVDSASSSSGSSEKGNTEMDVKKIEEKNSVDSKQKEAIKKQMAERKKSAGSEKTGSRRAAKQRGVDEDSSVRRSAEDVKAGAVEEKRPLPSAGKLKTPKAEVWIYHTTISAIQGYWLRVSVVKGYKQMVLIYLSILLAIFRGFGQVCCIVCWCVCIPLKMS